MRRLSWARSVSLLIGLFGTLVIPASAQALSSQGFLGTTALFLYGAIGFFGAAGMYFLVVGYSLYLVRMGLEGRTQGIRYMEWGVSIMFVVAVLSIILRLIQLV